MKSLLTRFLVMLMLIGAAQTSLAKTRARPVDPAEAKEAAIVNSLHPVTGDVVVPAAQATLHLGQAYYFLDAADSRRVLVDGWGNPPELADGVLGMVFPAGKTFATSPWGAVVTYEATGFVNDKDAKTANYDDLIKQSQSGEEQDNAERKKNGFQPTHLVGWAQPPSYDPTVHSLIWARDIKFGDQTDDTLNYDVRLLGRRGVLNLNMVSRVSMLGEIRPAAQAFGRAVTYNPGAKYADYADGDVKAKFGLAGLVAAGLGIVAVKKFGLLAVILLFGKKFIVVIIAGCASMVAFVRRRLGIKAKKPVGQEDIVS